MALLELVKHSATEVIKRASYLKLNEDRLLGYAKELLRQPYETPFYDPAFHYLGKVSDTACYLICLDTINFGSGYFPFLKKRRGMSGYFTVASYLKDWFETKIPSPYDLLKLSPEATATIFHQPMEHPKNRELMTLFSHALKDLAELLLNKYDASFTALLESANSEAEVLMQSLIQMPYFRDQCQYKGLEVAIYKRAQILPSDLFLALEGKGLGYFEDIDKLTIFADNLVPHVLHTDGILSYSPELLGLIRTPLEAGSEAEVEIRCAAIYAVELMVGQLQGQGIKTSARFLDMLLWNRGQSKVYREATRHRTYSVFY